MVEQNPEKNIWGQQTYECPTCSHIVKSNFDNTLVVKYFKQPWFNHVRVNCDEDGFVGVYWLDQMNFKDTWLSQFAEYQDNFCDEENIINLRRELFDIEELHPHELSRRVEASIAHWGEFLEHIVVDETDFGVSNG